MKKSQQMTRGELQFVREIEGQGKTWLYEPRKFALPSPYNSYTPDFFVIEDGLFYEISSSRQAYSYQREKVAAFKKNYPHLKIEIVNGGAWEVGPSAPRVDVVRRQYKHVWGRHGALTKLRRRKNLSPIAIELFEIMDDLNCRTVIELAQIIGVPAPHLYGILHGLKSGNRSIWEIRHRYKGLKEKARTSTNHVSN